MSSAAATSFTCTPGKLLNFTAVALNRSPYFSTLRGLAFATTHPQPVRPRCQLNRGKLGVGQQRAVRWQHQRSQNFHQGLTSIGTAFADRKLRKSIHSSSLHL